jgi:hypothetical protein
MGAVGLEMANDGQPPLRYPAAGQMSSFEGSHEAKVVVAENVGLMRRLSSHLSSRRPIERDSEETFGF